MAKESRSFSIDKEISERIDRVVDDIINLKAFELPFETGSQLVNFIFYETLPDIERKVEELKKKRRK